MDPPEVHKVEHFASEILQIQLGCCLIVESETPYLYFRNCGSIHFPDLVGIVLWPCPNELLDICTSTML